MRGPFKFLFSVSWGGHTEPVSISGMPRMLGMPNAWDGGHDGDVVAAGDAGCSPSFSTVVDQSGILMTDLFLGVFFFEI